MGIEVSGFIMLLIMIADIWAIVNLLKSGAATGKIVFWVLFILVLPLIGFFAWLLAGPRSAGVGQSPS